MKYLSDIPWVQAILLCYLRNFPLDFGKQKLSKWIRLPSENSSVKYKSKNGIYWQLDLNEYQMKQIFLFDVYERNTIRHLLKIINRKIGHSFIFLDVGANIGFYTLSVAKFIPSNYQIHCFEPNPSVFKLLNENIERNNIENVTLNEIGLSASEATAILTFNTKNLGTANIYTLGQQGIQTLIRLQSMDNYCENNNIEKIDIIKVDIEGGEFDFLKGAHKILNKSTKILMIMEIVEENCVRAGYSAKLLFDYCINLGFQAYLPRPWPFGLKKVVEIPIDYHDNIFFLKGYD